SGIRAAMKTADTLSLTHERVDDIPLLLGFMQQLNFPDLLEGCSSAFAPVGSGQKTSIGETEESLVNWAKGHGSENEFPTEGAYLWKAWLVVAPNR
ncbi:MAG: hypothetical protein ABSG68_04520, partial [Thermoguttaceae bacterium]